MTALHQVIWVSAMLAFTFTLRAAGGSIGCKDLDGNNVDWFYVYKIPMIKESKLPLIQKGVAFYYLDVNQQTFQLSNLAMSDQDNPVARTLNQTYNQQDELASVMYNDEWPDGRKTEARGHTKGVVAFNSNTGFWLIHSVPKFPSNSSYSWPSNALDNGQSMLCVTFSSSSMEDIAKQMMYTYPYVYSKNLPSDLLALAPTFAEVTKGHHVKGPVWTNKVTLSSKQGQLFVHYAKFTKFYDDLYVEFVAPDMKSNLETETWRNGRNPLESNCSSSFDVKNIQEISFPEVDFPSTKDHSKIAIADDSLQMICVGDINRALGQYVRGGGTLCSKLPSVWKQYTNIIAKVEPCP